MSKMERTDLSRVHGASSKTECMAILQPSLAFTLAKKGILDKEDAFLEEVFKSAVNMKGLTHRGSASYDAYDGWLKKFRPCGGKIVVEDLTYDDIEHYDLRAKGFDKLLIKCTDPDCALEAGASAGRGEVKSLMLNFMIKQMIPMFRSCFYIDLRQYHFREDHYSPEMVSEIKELGLISLSQKELCGYINVRPKELFKGYIGIGFLLATQMNTIKGCDELDEWLKLLLLKKIEEGEDIFKEIKSFFKTSRSRLFGKKV